MTRLLKTLRSDAKPSIQAQWERQCVTAGHILERFDDGHDVQLLGDEVGMGKTYVALAVMAEHLLSRGGQMRRAMLVTPASAVLRTKWEQEVRSFGENYVTGVSRKLQPIQINSFWELISNLHDYQDLSPKNVTGERGRCLLKVTWDWFSTRLLSPNGNPLRATRRPADTDTSAAEMVRFESEFSRAAWYTFLDDRNANGQIVAMLDRDRGMWKDGTTGPVGELKDLFREFLRHQGGYKPNVLIVPMSALRIPKRDSEGTRLFATFVLATLLKRRQKSTWERCLKAMKGKNILLNGVNMKSLQAWGDVDLYNTRSCIIPALNSAGLLQRWEDILEGRATNISDTFSAILAAVIARKVAESGITLAVVDEVHNWKGNTNGAPSFRSAFAPYVKHKLIMSATPIQLDKGEMRCVFENVARRDGKTWKALQELYGSGIVNDCLAANDALLAALKTLTSSNAADEVLRQIGMDSQQLQTTLETLANDQASPDAVAAFCRTALAYRNAVSRFEERLRELMVRHLRSDSQRSFHAGIDFGRDSTPHRPALYATSGISNPDDQWVNYLAMRLDQRVRREAGSARAKAHLLGGLTSSIAAFKKSAQSALLSPDAGTTLETRRYAEMVRSVLEDHCHPKVEATVAHALANARNGRKTLIFCERVETVSEIVDRITADLGHLEAVNELADWVPVKKVHDHESFIDIPFGCLLTPMDASIKHDVVDFVTQALDDTGANPTPRRIMRLTNLYLLSQLPTSALGELCKKAVDLFSSRTHLEQLRKEILGAKEQTASPNDQSRRVLKFVDEYFNRAPNLWLPNGGADEYAFRSGLLTLLESEAELVQKGYQGRDQARVTIGFVQTLLDLESGLKSVLMRATQSRAIAKGEDFNREVHRLIREPVGQGESPWGRMTRFVKQLGSVNGSINMDDQKSTDRKSLWRAVSLRGARTEESTPGSTQPSVQKLIGTTENPARIAICAAFNSPLAPDILVCTNIGSEGIDLHRECAEIIHHDMPWNPARLEQRNGRIDRLNSLSKMTGCNVRVGIPFLELGYERFQFSQLLSRAQLFQVLLGKLDFDKTDTEAEADSDDDTIPELDPDASADDGTPSALLPESLAKWLSVDFSVWRPTTVSLN